MNTEQLPQREDDDTIDVSYHALRMGLAFPVKVTKAVYKRHITQASNPDRDTFVMLQAACESIDAAVARDEPMETLLPFHYEHKPKGFRATDVRLYVSLNQDAEGLPWILVSSKPQPSPGPSGPEVSLA